MTETLRAVGVDAKYKVESRLSSEGNDPPSPPGTAELLMGQAAGDELPRRDGALGDAGGPEGRPWIPINSPASGWSQPPWPPAPPGRSRVPGSLRREPHSSLPSGCYYCPCFAGLSQGTMLGTRGFEPRRSGLTVSPLLSSQRADTGDSRAEKIKEGL